VAASALLRILLALLLPSTFLTACCTVGTALSLAGQHRQWIRRIGSVLLGIGVAGFAAVFFLPVDVWLLRMTACPWRRVRSPCYDDSGKSVEVEPREWIALMAIAELKHRQTGMSFSEWLDDPASWPAMQPISLVEIIEALHGAFDGSNLVGREWLDARELYLAALLRRGLRPMLPNYKASTWEWTDRFNGFEENDDSPESIAAAAFFSLYAFGDSGGAKHLRFGTHLSAGSPPERTQFDPG
jgi:hypothetical protein